MRQSPQMEKLVDRLAFLKEEEADLKERIKEARSELESELDFGGKRTVHLFGNRYKATVQMRTDVKWDQDKIERLRAVMPESDFFDLFKWEYKHSSKKTLDAYLKLSEFKDSIKEACEEVRQANSYAFERLGQED